MIQQCTKVVFIEVKTTPTNKKHTKTLLLNIISASDKFKVGETKLKLKISAGGQSNHVTVRTRCNTDNTSHFV